MVAVTQVLASQIQALSLHRTCVYGFAATMVLVLRNNNNERMCMYTPGHGTNTCHLCSCANRKSVRNTTAKHTTKTHCLSYTYCPSGRGFIMRPFTRLLAVIHMRGLPSKSPPLLRLPRAPRQHHRGGMLALDRPVLAVVCKHFNISIRGAWAIQALHHCQSTFCLPIHAEHSCTSRHKVCPPLPPFTAAAPLYCCREAAMQTLHVANKRK